MKDKVYHADQTPMQTSENAPLHLTPKEEMETTLIRSLIASYFNITRQTIQDLVPKAIMHLLVSQLECFRFV